MMLLLLLLMMMIVLKVSMGTWLSQWLECHHHETAAAVNRDDGYQEYHPKWWHDLIKLHFAIVHQYRTILSLLFRFRHCPSLGMLLGTRRCDGIIGGGCRLSCGAESVPVRLFPTIDTTHDSVEWIRTAGLKWNPLH